MDALEAFKAAGLRQVILSASNLDTLRRQTDERGVTGYFDRLLGLGDIYAKSKVEVGLAYLKENGFDPARAVMIGDSVHDYEVAQALGVPESVIALTFVALGTSLPDTGHPPVAMRKFHQFEDVLKKLPRIFSYIDFINAAKELGISVSTAKRYLRKAVEQELVVKQKDKYRKRRKRQGKQGL